MQLHAASVFTTITGSSCGSLLACEWPRDHLCDHHVALSVYHLGGTAGARGMRWAESVARRRPDLLDRPWPALEGRALAIAAEKVAELSADARVREQLTAACWSSAVRVWERERAERRR